MIGAAAFLLVAGTFAVARSWVIAALNRPGFAWGTLAVNTLGSLAAGVVAAHAPRDWSTVVKVAALGAFTTFSTFAVEVVEQWSRRRAAAVAYAVVTMAGAIGAAVVGLAT